MNIQIDHVPFARCGSYMTFSVLPPFWGHTGLMMRTMHRGQFHEAWRLKLIRDGAEIDYSVSATPTLATLTPTDGGPGVLEICLPESEVARFRLSGGLHFRLQSVAVGKKIYAFPVNETWVNVNASANKVQYWIIPHRGTMAMEMPVHIGDHKRAQKKKSEMEKRPEHPLIGDWTPDDTGTIEFSMHEYVMTPRHLESLDWSFDQCHAEAVAHWEAWEKTTLPVPEAYREGARHASHVNYASTVSAWGFLKRPTTLMSRNWMTSCWSWDHCFNAIAYAPGQPELAWDQLNVHFHLQEPGGALPDGVNGETCGWNFCKPPIHGWALALMERLNPGILTEERLRDFYPKLVRWTEWWFNVRDTDGDGLPEYRHGNDSGWDNSTVFDHGFPCCSPDLQGHLVNQMDQLASMARRLGLNAEAARWSERSDRHIEKTIEKLWDEEKGQFRAFRALTGEREEVGNSLINHLILVMGDRLPQPYRDRVAKFVELDGAFVTEYGPATEAPESPKYLESGYWRGPIWGSSTTLLIDGLHRGGYVEQAAGIARRYCDMCVKNQLFAENYDPIHGTALCDKAYTWGSSAYLILAHHFVETGR